MSKLVRSLKETLKDMKACAQMMYLPLLPLMKSDTLDQSDGVPYGHLRLRDIDITILTNAFKSDISSAGNPISKGLTFLGWTVVLPPLALIEFALVLPLAVGATSGRFLIGVLQGGYYGIYDLKTMAAGEAKPILVIDAQETISSNSSTMVMKQLDVQPEKLTRPFSDYMQNYFQSFEAIEPYSLQIEKLQLTKEEESRFSNFLDIITAGVPDIPVTLNEERYDLQTVLKCFDKNKMDPMKKVSFKLEHVVPDRNANNQIKTLIETIKNERAQSQSQVSNPGLVHDKNAGNALFDKKTTDLNTCLPKAPLHLLDEDSLSLTCEDASEVLLLRGINP